jgi:RNA polymerase sigma factor (sigma-70 family)
VPVDEGFAAFCRREHPRLVGALTLWCGERAVAEELTQEAFARAHRDWQKVGALDQPAAWVRHVALNLATSSFRRRQAERRAYGRLAARAEVATSDADVADAVAVRDAVGRLPELQRSVIVLRFYLEMSVDEVAELVGRSRTAVTSLTSRAVSALRDDLGPPTDLLQQDEEHAP